jgi:flagellar motor switch protein FliN
MSPERQRAQFRTGRGVEKWSAELAEVLEELTGSRPTIRKAPAGELPREKMFWWSGGEPVVRVGISARDASLLQGLRAPLNGPANTPDAAPAIFGHLMDRSWEISGVVSSEPPAEPAAYDCYDLRLASGESLQLFARLAENPAPVGSNLEMLMDIELPVTLRFGCAQMALRDIAELSSGSFVELDRGIDDPIEILINGHVIALGEAVTIRGAYGVRISEISGSREKWLASSFAGRKNGQASTGGYIA